MAKLKLRRAVFLQLHRKVCEEFDKRCKEKGTWEEFDKFQYYGYEYPDPTKPSIVKYMEKDPRVKKILDRYSNKKGEPAKINGFYLYSRYLDCIHRRETAIILTGHYKEVFFAFINKKNVDAFLKTLEEEEVNNPDATLLEEIKRQKSSSDSLKKWLTYGAFFYSVYRNTINCIEIKIEITPGVEKQEKKKQITEYPVEAREIFPTDIKDIPKTFKGEAKHDQRYLHINLESDDSLEAFQIILTAEDSDIENERLNILVGSYVGISFRADNIIISGKIVFELDIFEPSIEVKRYLFIERRQTRTMPGIYLKKRLEDQIDRKHKTNTLVKFGGHWLVFVIDPQKRLVKMVLHLNNEDFSFIMESPNTIYYGRVFIKEGTLLQFEIKQCKRQKDLRKKDLYGMVHVDISVFEIGKEMEGSFIWWEDGYSHSLYGKCIIAKIDKKENPLNPERFDENTLPNKKAERIYSALV